MARAGRPDWRTSSFTENGSSCVEVAPGAGWVWRTSSFTDNGQTCVEVAPGAGWAWRTSSFTSNGQSCVEVVPGPECMLVRDTKDRGTGPVLHLAIPAWAAFTAAALDARPATADGLAIVREPRTTVHAGREVATSWHVTAGDVTLHYTDAEWTAFADGIRAREFAELVPA
jgi:Domain of unknown function (DUF397)